MSTHSSLITLTVLAFLFGKLSTRSTSVTTWPICDCRDQGTRPEVYIMACGYESDRYHQSAFRNASLPEANAPRGCRSTCTRIPFTKIEQPALAVTFDAIFAIYCSSEWPSSSEDDGMPWISPVLTSNTTNVSIVSRDRKHVQQSTASICSFFIPSSAGHSK